MPDNIQLHTLLTGGSGESRGGGENCKMKRSKQAKRWTIECMYACQRMQYDNKYDNRNLHTLLTSEFGVGEGGFGDCKSTVQKQAKRWTIECMYAYQRKQ